MSLLIKKGNIQRYIIVPAQIIPNIMYNVIMTYCGLINDHLPLLCWQTPKQLQTAILTMFKFS